MKNEKIKVMPVRKKHTHLTATLSLPLRLHERAWILTGSRSLSNLPGPADPGSIAGRSRI